MNKTIVKILVVIIGCFLVPFPLIFAITSPDYLPWLFYIDFGGLFGTTALLAIYFAYKIFDSFN